MRQAILDWNAISEGVMPHQYENVYVTLHQVFSITKAEADTVFEAEYRDGKFYHTFDRRRLITYGNKGTITAWAKLPECSVIKPYKQ